MDTGIERHSTPVERTSASVSENRLANLREMLPDVFTEDKIDFEKLRGTLGDELDDRPERYLFTSAGKRDAIRILQTPSRATLIPTASESVQFEKAEDIFIEGENLEVLKLLYKAYFGKYASMRGTR